MAQALESGSILIAARLPTTMPEDSTAIITADPRYAFAVALRALYPDTSTPDTSTPDTSSPSIHPTAIVHPDARIHPSVKVQAYAWIGPRVRIGPESVIHAHAVIGGAGFSYVNAPDGSRLHMPHIGGLAIGAHVAVGSFTTIREGTINPTLVGDEVKIDDHVHIAHNCRIDRGVTITAGAIIAGSVHIQEGSWIGPNATVSDGLTVGPQIMIGAGAVVLKDCDLPGTYAGNPARRFS